jgi:hypothetical protein
LSDTSGPNPGGGGAKIGKNMICLRKIVIFHTKYPNNFRASPRSAQFFLNATPLLEILDPPLYFVKRFNEIHDYKVSLYIFVLIVCKLLNQRYNL